VVAYRLLGDGVGHLCALFLLLCLLLLLFLLGQRCVRLLFLGLLVGLVTLDGLCGVLLKRALYTRCERRRQSPPIL
jgi:hypothetical protein